MAPRQTVSKTPAGRTSALRAPLCGPGVKPSGGGPSSWASGVGPTSNSAHTSSSFRAAEGAHAMLPACPECGPTEAHPLLHFGRTAFELCEDPDHHPGGSRYLRIEGRRSHPVMHACDVVGGKDRRRSKGDSRRSGAHGGEWRETMKIACGVAWSQLCRCLMFASCLLYVW